MSASDLKPTAEQIAAIHCQIDQFAIRAAAGSGKTRVLVQKYLHHVVTDGFDPDVILTLTFTRKAASEMKSRIVEDLMSAGLVEQARIAETGPIQTIHSFCERTLREYALLTEVDPEFEIISGLELDELRSKSYRKALGELHETDHLVKQLVRELAGRAQYGQADSLDSFLRSEVNRILDKFRSSLASRSSLRAIYRDADSYLEHVKSYLQELVNQTTLTQNGTTLDQIRECIREVKYQGKKSPFLELTDQQWLENANRTCAVVKLAVAVWTDLEQNMIEIQKFDYNMLESLTIRAIERSESLCRKLQDKFKVILVDEAQDLSPLQYKLLSQLAISKEMLVGDPYQSIYRFRHADYRLFDTHLESKHSLGLTKNHRSLDTILQFIDTLFGHLWPTYAPMAAPIEPIQPNGEIDPFEEIDTENFAGVELWKTRGNETQPIVAGIKQLIEEGTKPGQICILMRSHTHTPSLVAKLKQNNVPCRVVGQHKKFYTQMVVRDLANVLTALVHPYDDFAMLATIGSPFVGASLDTQVLLAKAKPIYTALHNEKPGTDLDSERLEEFSKWFNHLVNTADRLSAWELLAELFARSPYLYNVANKPNAEQNLANIRKLFMQAAAQPNLRPSEYAESIREIQLIEHQERDAPPIDTDPDEVQIMTIHSSKGLEFNTVVLFNAFNRYQTSSSISDVSSMVVATHYETDKNPAFAFMELRDQKEAEDEEWRLLYVAMTRAEARLCLPWDTQTRANRTYGKQIFTEMGWTKTPAKSIRIRELIQLEPEF